MKWKIFIALLLVTTVMAVGIVTTSSKNHLTMTAGENRKVAPKTNVQQNVVPEEQPQDPPGTINGAVNPELIPDDVAYTLMFRVVGNRQTDEEKSSIRSYLRQAGLGCQNCGEPQAQAQAPEEPDIDAVIAAADEYWKRTDALDKQVEEIKGRAWPNPSPQVMAQLQQLETQNKAIVADILASIPKRLNPDAVEKLRDHIDSRVKHNVKIYPETSLPGGPGWKHTTPNH